MVSIESASSIVKPNGSSSDPHSEELSSVPQNSKNRSKALTMPNSTKSVS